MALYVQELIFAKVEMIQKLQLASAMRGMLHNVKWYIREIVNGATMRSSKCRETEFSKGKKSKSRMESRP